MPGPACNETSANWPLCRLLIEQFALRISGFGFQLLDLGIDMAVADQNVGPAIVVEIEKAAAPAQILRVRAQPRGEGGIFESCRRPDCDRAKACRRRNLFSPRSRLPSRS